MKAKPKQVYISIELYKELISARDSLEKTYKKNFTILETSKRLGKYLNTLRNSKL